MESQDDSDDSKRPNRYEWQKILYAILTNHKRKLKQFLQLYIPTYAILTHLIVIERVNLFKK
jgi:hypothetical protein